MQKTISNQYGLEGVTEVIRKARLAKGWSQRDLAGRAPLTQAQISRIESGEADLQVSTLIELARSLDLDVQLVPKTALVAVEAAVRSAEERAGERIAQNLVATLVRLADEAQAAAPDREDVASIASGLRELKTLLPVSPGALPIAELERLKSPLQDLLDAPPTSRRLHAQRFRDAAAWLKTLRNTLAHTPQAERPAYRLDDEDA